MDGKKLKQFQKNLKASQTVAEMKLWHFLRNRSFMGFKFRRQQIIKNYIVDFVCHEKNLILELDGSQHQDQKVYDHMRTQELIQAGYQVVRFWNNEVLNETDSVLSKIYNLLINV